MISEATRSPQEVAEEHPPGAPSTRAEPAARDRGPRRHLASGHASVARALATRSLASRARSRGGHLRPVALGARRPSRGSRPPSARPLGPDDRRRVGLELAREGQSLLKRVRARRTTWLAARLALLSDEEQSEQARRLPCPRRCTPCWNATLSVSALALPALRGRRSARCSRHRNYRLFFSGQIISAPRHVDAEHGPGVARGRPVGSRSRSAASPSAGSCPFSVFGLVSASSSTASTTGAS